jgi:hypothetical protein
MGRSLTVTPGEFKKMPPGRLLTSYGRRNYNGARGPLKDPAHPEVSLTPRR